jgi:ABC-type Fe3+-hydroxamate transport system substrate-binding protein
MHIRILLPVAAGLTVALGACSSGTDEAAPTVAASPTVSPTEEVIVEEEIILIDGCGAYYEFDLVRSTVASGTEDLTRKQKRELLRDYRAMADGMVTDMEASVAAGDLPERSLDNAARIQTNLDKAATKKGTDGISAAQAERIDKSSQRIEAQCEAAGDLVPQENLDARTPTP